MIRYLIALSLWLLIACQGDEPDPQLTEAFAAHQLALRTHDSLRHELETLPTQSLTTAQQQELTRLQQARQQWQTNLVEVPGFEHAEEHSHDHQHDHATDALQGLPPAEILSVQQALVQEVQRLLDDARRLLVKIEQTSSTSQ